jgi:hypothetical protein
MLNVVLPRSFQSRRGEGRRAHCGSQALERTCTKARGQSGLGREGEELGARCCLHCHQLLLRRLGGIKSRLTLLLMFL